MSRLIKDPIHGNIEFDKKLFQIIDTPQFQRLRDLMQLGTTYWVFPGASHRRFEHSIGTAFLANEVVSTLQRKQPELKITNKDNYLVTLAGLCHDLGHGPYSHVFDNVLIPTLCGKDFKWKHEDMSCLMFDHLIDQNNIDIDNDDALFVKSLINPEKYGTRDDKMFLYDIVSNSRNSIDVDKFDYINRDCYNIGMNSSFDHSRLINLCRVIDNQICYHEKEKTNIYEMFRMRYRLFREVYSHKTSKAIELMICDALYYANPIFGFSDIIKSRDPAQFMKLTDGIVGEIETSTNPALKQSQELIKRINNRDLYKKVDEVLITDDDVLEYATEDIISKFCHNVAPQDLIVDIYKLNYSMGGNDPVKSTRFFSPKFPNVSMEIDKKTISYLLPNKFQDKFIRLFVRDSNKEEDAKNGFNKFLKLYS